MPVIEHEGRLWRAIEDAHTGEKWGERYRPRMISAPLGADLLRSDSWTISEPLARDPVWLDGTFLTMIEGNAVITPEGKVVDILRVNTRATGENAAIVNIGPDGATTSFNPATDFIDLPGGSKKFTVRKDPKGPGYWALTNIVSEIESGASDPASIRNTLALMHSTDLRKWEIRCILLRHPDPIRHAFQYIDWQFDGEDLIAASRTAWDDAEGGAHRGHDANFLTFHRWKNFRSLTRKDDSPMPRYLTLRHSTKTLRIETNYIEVGTLANGEIAFSNRKYTFTDVPETIAGREFVRQPGGVPTTLFVTALSDTTLTIATGEKVKLPAEWQDSGMSFSYNAAKKSPFKVFTRDLKKGKTVRLPAGKWSGTLLILER